MVPLCFPPYKAKIIKETAPKGFFTEETRQLRFIRKIVEDGVI